MKNIRDVVNNLPKNSPGIQLSHIAKSIGVSAPTVGKYCEIMEARGEVTTLKIGMNILVRPNGTVISVETPNRDIP